jgi:hypothetical protein
MDRLFQRVSPWIPALLGALLIAGIFRLDVWLRRKIADQQAEINQLRRNADQAGPMREHYASLRDLKTSDVETFKTGFSGLALSQKSLFEAGLSVQEERRLLDKQLEIMTTYMLVTPALQRVFLMRGEQPLQSYLISYIPLRAFGGVPETLPPSVRIISKERYAHPERGKSEAVNGQLQYNPPQVGTSVRSNALGEFVIFTNSKLILHGPPLNPEDHEKFPHICLGLDLEAARKLYRGSFIGTKIVINAARVTSGQENP